MNTKTRIISTLVAIAVGLSLAFLFRQDIEAKAKHHDAIVDKVLPLYPELKSLYDTAMSDNVLTKKEAKIILDAAKKLKESKEN